MNVDVEKNYLIILLDLVIKENQIKNQKENQIKNQKENQRKNNIYL
jgi:hypothetical protein